MIKKLSFDDFLLMTTRERENKEPEKKNQIIQAMIIIKIISTAGTMR